MWNAGPESVRWISIGRMEGRFDITDILKSGGSDLVEVEQTADKRIDPNETDEMKRNENRLCFK